VLISAINGILMSAHWCDDEMLISAHWRDDMLQLCVLMLGANCAMVMLGQHWLDAQR
jgi:hypothetical protein